MKVLLDSDTISNMMRRHPNALRNAAEYLDLYPAFTFSIITHYEVLRGLKIKDALKQMRVFESFSAASEILPITSEIIDKASDIYAELYRSGKLIGDADILIAATALVNDCMVATNNSRHFARIRNLSVINWLSV
jgi:tRNA(fMet)-specific endonuclease VapC